jgi:cell division protein FtsI/penicillin-binding protein 2
VFGKLGAHSLGKDVIEEYAEAFGFNREIEFELPLRPSRIEFSDKAYELAEVASGFNRTTRISPLHGAIMAAAIVNNGWLVEPTIVDWILNDAGKTIYQNHATIQGQAIDRQTAVIIQELMQATVQTGTARKEFQKHTEGRILSRLEIGGKTGSIGDGTPNRLYDWFVGYAAERHGTGRLVFSVVVAHENYIGTRAVAYATMAVKEYFHSQIAGLENTHPAAPKS